MYRKILLIFIVAFINNNSLKTLLALLTLAISVFLQKKFLPLSTNELNQVELLSSIAALTTLYFGFLNFLQNSNATKIIIICIVSAVNGFFLFYWFWKMILFNLSELHSCLKIVLKRFFPRLFQKYNSFFIQSLIF